MAGNGRTGPPSGRELDRAADLLLARRPAAALTGAGISAESGIPTFRGGGGLWDRYDIEEYGTADAFRRDPGKVWLLLRDLSRECAAAAPNEGHRALARLEAMGLLAGIVTQNVDGLHQRAGSRAVFEFHGSCATLHCTRCGRLFRREEIPLETLPPRCGCGAPVKPDVVLFGDPIPEEALQGASDLALRCGLLLVVGTSAEVFPAAAIPGMARQAGAAILELNPERTVLSPYVDLSLRGTAAEVLHRLLRRVEEQSRT